MLLTPVLLFAVVYVSCPAESFATYAQDKVIQATAAVQESPPQITLSWPKLAGAKSICVSRKNREASSWEPQAHVLDSTATSYVDAGVSIGTPYEYSIEKETPEDSCTARKWGYVYAGIKVPLVENRGKLILIVDGTHAKSLASELGRLQWDLVGDGWTVLRHDVARTDTAANVKNLVVADYTADPSNVKAVFLLGHIPVPYSGDMCPDGHADHYGAWPADLFYGDVDGTWTDTAVNRTSAKRAANRNVPGDGKFDQSIIPSGVELMVGRVDLSNMPAFSSSEEALLRQYLDKNHAYRHGITVVSPRALVDDNLQNLKEGVAQTGWRFASLVGPAAVSSGEWSSMTSRDYLLAYGCGYGSYTNIGTCAGTADYAAKTYKAIFQMSFGSYFGDWDNADNVLRAPLCNPTYGLTSCWVGRPNWCIHHLALGEPIGYAFLVTNQPTLYSLGNGYGGVHVALMGDPTLRLHVVPPPSGLKAAKTGEDVELSWTAPPDPGILGYHVYRAGDEAGPFARLTADLIDDTSYTCTLSEGNNCAYMIRAVRLERSVTGSYYNASQGVFTLHPPQGGSQDRR